VKAVDEAGGEEGGVEARAGFSEESEDAFFAEFVEHFFERDAACVGGRTSTRTPWLSSSRMRDRRGRR